MTDRKYLPTFAELCDRLSIVLLKQVFVGIYRDSYRAERELIEHDLDQMLNGSLHYVSATEITALLVLMLSNREIWLNESKARAGGPEQDKLLKFTHSINGVRARAKNVIANAMGERVDLKVDALAADLPAEYGNWSLFDDT